MRIGSKFLASLLAVAGLWLSGCASAPQLGQADTRGFHAGGATVRVDYTPPKDSEATDADVMALRDLRREDMHRLLQGHGFRPVTSGESAFQIRVAEGEAREVTGEWTGAVGANVALFTLGIVPAVFEYRSDVRYELWSGEKRLHAIGAPASWKEAVGLVSLASALSGSDANRQQALSGTHDSVIRLWIDQGSFDQ